MNEDQEFETYLSLSPKRFCIYLFNTKNSKNVYKNDFEFKIKSEVIDLNHLKIFIEENIFKIEKLIGKFVKNIFLIIESSEINIIEIGIKKKIIRNI